MVEADLERAEERAEAGEGYVVTWFRVTNDFLSFGFLFCVLSLSCQRKKKKLYICINQINTVRMRFA